MFVGIKRLKAILTYPNKAFLIFIKVDFAVNVTYSNCYQTMPRLNERAVAARRENKFY